MESREGGVVRRQRVLVVDDEEATRKLVSRVLSRLGVEITEALGGCEALSAATLTKPSLVLLDLGLPDVDGLELLRMLRNEHPDVPVVVVSGASSVDSVVEAMRMGARDFVTKPFEPERLRVAVTNGLQHLALGKRVEELEQCIDRSHPFDSIVGCSNSMGALFSTMKKLAVSSATVLIQGETGVGKELVARALHFKGKRGKGPFVELNCAAIPASLLENELFGHESEAFTGANHRRAGRIELADGGTLFLDEIGELDLASQAKLLRVLQDRRLERLGGGTPLQVNVRIIAATNRDLADEVREGRFREDLYYRLSVYPIYVPPLRERKQDIPALVDHFLRLVASEEQRTCPIIDSNAVDLLANHDWPGNARELQNVVRRAMVSMEGDTLRVRDLPTYIRGRQASEFAAQPNNSLEVAELLSLRELERRHICLALERGRGNLSEVARILGIGRTTLYRKIEKYGLQESDSDPRLSPSI